MYEEVGVELWAWIPAIVGALCVLAVAYAPVWAWFDRAYWRCYEWWQGRGGRGSDGQSSDRE